MSKRKSTQPKLFFLPGKRSPAATGLVEVQDPAPVPDVLEPISDSEDVVDVNERLDCVHYIGTADWDGLKRSKEYRLYANPVV